MDGSGSGKSASYVIPNAYQLLGSYVFTDPKGELYDKTAGYLKTQGYDIKIFNLVNPKNSDGYNPLIHIQNEIDVDIIANTIVKGQSDVKNQSDPYWDDMAEMLLKALIYYLLATRPPEEQNLASCAELVRAANNSGGGNLLTELMNQLPYDHPARMNYKSIEIAPEKTYSSILSSLQSKLGKFDSRDIADLTSTNTINFEDIGRKKTALYVISSDTHAAYDFLLTIFFSQMIQHLYDFADLNGGALPQPTYFILDEFANIGQIPQFEKLIATIRSREISASIILQSQSQLKAIYKDAAEIILDNADSTLFLGGRGKNAKDISENLGRETIDSFNTSENRGTQVSHGLNYQKLGKELMTQDEIAVMDGGKCILQLRGVRPFFSDKYDLTKHPRYKYLSDADKKNVFDVERYMKRRPAIVKPDEPFDMYELSAKELEPDNNNSTKRKET